MPLFEYRCAHCRREFELLVRTHEIASCPDCGASDIEKLLSETAATVGLGQSSLPLASSCPPGNAPCGPACCRLP